VKTSNPKPETLPTVAQEFLASTKVFVLRSVKVGKSGEEATSSDLPQTIEIHKFVTEPAGVYVQDEVKLSKNYNSAGHIIGVYRPCYAEEIDVAKEWANNFVHTALSEQMPELVTLVDKLGEL
jgi:hypothetical protein